LIVAKAKAVARSAATGKFTARSRAQAARTRVVLAKKLGVSTPATVNSLAQKAPVKS
jgi:carboxylesterase type B